MGPFNKKACWSKHLPELLMAFNTTRSTVTGYSPYYLLFDRRPRIPVDYLFPTLRDSPHQTKMEVSVTAMQRRLKEAFTVARQLASEDAAKQCRYYDRKAGVVALAKCKMPQTPQLSKVHNLAFSMLGSLLGSYIHQELV